MMITARHPLDGVLADWATLVRRIHVGTVNETAWRIGTDRIRAELAKIDPALAHRIGAALDRLEQVEECERMTLALFDAAAREIRDAITARRFNAKPVLVVIQGGHAHQSQLQGA